MFDFKKEVAKFKPILEIDQIETAIHNNEVQDIMDLLKDVIREETEKNTTDGE